MENIQMFLNFCENYGVPKTGLFQTVDLFEGRNMAQVLNCIQMLGTEVSEDWIQDYAGYAGRYRAVSVKNRLITNSTCFTSSCCFGDNRMFLPVLRRRHL